MSNEPDEVAGGAAATGSPSSKGVIAIVALGGALALSLLCCVFAAGFYAYRSRAASPPMAGTGSSDLEALEAAALELSEMSIKENGIYKGVIETDGSIKRDGLYVGKLDGTAVQVDGLWKGEVAEDGSIKVDGLWKGELSDDGSLKWDGAWRAEIGDDGSIKVDGQYVAEVDGYQPTPANRRAVAAYLVFFARVFGG